MISTNTHLIDTLTPEVAKNIRGVLTDIDGTITKDGKLIPEAYFALWQLQSLGLYVIPVTGRPAGWCDAMARQWPIDGIIGENGAFAFYEEQGTLKRMYHPNTANQEQIQQLQEIGKSILQQVPLSRISPDQSYRLFDLAIDYAEEEPRLSHEKAQEIKDIFEQHHVHAKISSIHVNGWYGEYDKLSMTKNFLQHRFEIDLENEKERWIYCGDSPNDEPMFEFFPNACGMANIKHFKRTLKHWPHFITQQEGGHGFAEMTSTLLRIRS